MKSLKELSAQLEERTYHALPYLSYSILARYEREGGFKSLPEKWKDLWQPCPETEALLIGSAVDCLVTAEGDREEAFNKEFIVVDIDRIPDKTRQVVDTMVERGIRWEDTNAIADILDEIGFYPNWKLNTRISKITEGDAGRYYYHRNLAKESGKRILSSGMYDTVLRCVKNLESNELTNHLLWGKLPDHQERFFQLQFTTTIGGVDYKIMCDMIIVDHKKKSIHIYDLKTSSKESYEFKQSYLEWGYHIQSWLYRIVLKDFLCFYPEYDGYSVDEFSFIVASKSNNTPLVYDDKSEISHTKPWLRNPLDIGQEIFDSYEEGSKDCFVRKSIPTNFTCLLPNNIEF